MPFTQQDREALLQELQSLADPNYRTFHLRLLPGSDAAGVLGVRTPVLRQVAKRLANGDFRGFLAAAQSDLYEERILQALVIGGAKCDIEERLSYIAGFVPKIDSWAVCDLFCSALQCTKQHRELMYDFLLRCLDTGEEYQIRFVAVMLMCYYLDDAHIEDVLRLYEGIHHEGYYVKMAVAWGVATALAKCRGKTLAYLRHCGLDDWTYNKAVQKACESYRISLEDKALLRGMKRGQTGNARL
ncbi:MAG: DNA alkylation repair protein [Christensenellaceae bacterium]|jgi:3-methyladenine DNA glycosylase AlkD|nr:DNA alkylation repair protein [Christensenellaceae bacterium]